MSDEFDFESTESWEVSTDRWMPIGNHVAAITYIDAEQSSSGGYPMIALRLEDADGQVAKDWLVISSVATFGKFKSLVLAAGVSDTDAPKKGKDYDASTGQVKQSYAMKLLNRKVGVVIRARRDKPEQGEVVGYVLPGEITDDMPADTRGLPEARSSSRPKGEKSRIPF